MCPILYDLPLHIQILCQTVLSSFTNDDENLVVVNGKDLSNTVPAKETVSFSLSHCSVMFVHVSLSLCFRFLQLLLTVIEMVKYRLEQQILLYKVLCEKEILQIM
jgi:hypothetical protein